MCIKRKHTCILENNPEKCEECEEKFTKYTGEPCGKEMIESHVSSHLQYMFPTQPSLWAHSGPNECGWI